MRTVLWLTSLAFVLVLVRMSFFAVGPTEYVYVTEFGRHVATYDGSDTQNDAGLHWRWPWPVQSVQRVDRRLQYFDLPVAELLTRDAATDNAGNTRIGKNLIVETYACWRITDRQAVDQFLRSVGTAERARALLGHQINSQLGALTGRRRLEEIISTTPGKAEATLEKLQQDLVTALRPQAQKYGIDLVDVRLRRFNHPPSVRESIFASIRSERDKLVQEIQSKGEAEAKGIRSEAEKDARIILAKAGEQETEIKTAGDAAALQARTDAARHDPELYAHLNDMENLERVLVALNKTTLWLSVSHPLWRLLTHGPQLSTPAPGNMAVGGGPPGKGPAAPTKARPPSGTNKKGGQ
jgi:membrane protease subunit HflC